MVCKLAAADVAIACAGGTGGEQNDRTSLELDQHAFLTALAASDAAAATPLVVLAFAPGAIVASPWAAGASAVLNMFLPGEQAGHAAADVLLGAVNPSGRLPVTFLDSAADATPICETELHCPLTEGLAVGWRGLIGKTVAFPFGHGLSYTSFAYAWSATPRRAAAGGGAGLVEMAVTVTNAGGVAGREVVQLYLEYPPSAAEPPLVLRHFHRTALLAPAESETVTFVLSERDVSIWAAGAWARAPGSFKAVVGASSRDHRLTETFVI